MYNNANVLYKASFADGISKIDRIQLRDKSRKHRIAGKKDQGGMDPEASDWSEWEREREREYVVYLRWSIILLYYIKWNYMNDIEIFYFHYFFIYLHKLNKIFESR